MVQVDLLKENVYSLKGIGYLDLDFHGCVFRNEEGASYNSYVIIDEQVTLIDIVEEEYVREFLVRLKFVLNGRKVDNIIINHVEPDHSGGFESVMECYPDAKCYCSSEAKKAMTQMFFKDQEYTVVKNLEQLNTGKYDLTFILTPFIHWPDNMVTYLNQEKILFSNDAFGSLVSSNKLYDDQYEYTELIRQAKEYYANIIMSGNRYVVDKLNEISNLNLEFDLICPSHGVIWRSNVQEILDQYMRWAINGDEIDKVVIIYDTIWDNTQMITDEIAVAIASHGYEVRIFNASKHRKSLIMSELMDAKAILVGSSNFNNTMTPSIADMLERIIALKPRSKYAMAFGSYGWADVHLNRIESRLKEAGLKIINQALYENYTPDEASLIYAASVGDKVATKLREMEQHD